jgi:hypothetical protein
VIVLLSLVTAGAAFAGPVLAQDSFSVEVSETVVEPGGGTSVTLHAENAEHLRIVGDTQGWTVDGMDPVATIIGNPTDDDGLPYQSGDESWYYAETTHDRLAIDLSATVPAGEYQFTAQELDAQDNVVAEEEFTIQVGETDTDEPQQPVGKSEFTATNTEGTLIIGGAETTEIGLEPGILEIEGIIDEQEGTWESTGVTVGDLTVQDFDLSVSVPDGFEGEFDRETDTISIEGDIVIDALADRIRLEIAGSSDAVGAAVDLEEGTAALADDTFVVEETNNQLINDALGLPATEPGENRLELTLNFEIQEAEAGPPAADIESLVFEDVAVEGAETRSTTITNTGDRPLRVTDLTVDHDAFQVDTAVDSIGPGGSVDVQVTFEPETVGGVEATLSVLGPDGVPAGNQTIEAVAVEPESEESADDTGPGFGVVVPLVALVTVLLARWSRTQ